MTTLLSACAISPVGVTRVDPTDVHRRLTRSALSTGRLSVFTRNILLETNLANLYESDPEKALERLHDLAVSGSGRAPQLFPAAEASFLHAEPTGKHPYHLAAALYAWAYLFPEDASEKPSPFDLRFQLAASLYNRGLTSALESAKERKIGLGGGSLELPFGQLYVSFDPNQLVWRGRRMTWFEPITEFDVFGLQAPYREPGIGAPLAAAVAQFGVFGPRPHPRAPGIGAPRAAVLEPLERERQPGDLLRADLTLPVTV